MSKHKVPFNAFPRKSDTSSNYIVIVKNAGKCKKCGDVIESRTVHDYKSCKCGECAVDGGLEYLRRINPDLIEDLSESITISEEEYQEWKKAKQEYMNSPEYKRKEDMFLMAIYADLQKAKEEGKKEAKRYSSMFGKSDGDDGLAPMGIGVR